MKKSKVPDDYRRAFHEVLARIQEQLRGARPDVFPIRMYIAGGAALHLLTGERTTEDVDATFSKKVFFDEISVSYRDPDGRARIMYLDRNCNDTLGLLHESAYDDSQTVDVPGIDRNLIDARVLSPIDLAVSKLARFTDQDRQDIELLARRGLIDAQSVCERAEQALAGYVGNIDSVRTSIQIASRLIESLQVKKPPARARKKSKSH